MDTATLNTKGKAWLDAAKNRVRVLEAALHAKLFAPDTTKNENDFLPNFCHGWVVFNAMVAAEMLALIISLVMPRDLLSISVGRDWLLVSVFVQWVTLSGTAALCYTRKYLNRLPNLRALGAAYLILLVCTFIVSEASIWLLWAIGQAKTPRPEWYADFHILTLTISAIANGLLLRYFLAAHESRQRTLSEARAKLQALQSRIRPHFVFNSLNIIASLTRTEPAKAEAAIEDMADLFRMMLSEDENLVPLKNEIDVAKKYLALENLRLDSRLRVEWDVGTFPRKTAVPVLTLQPLLENAIRHGIENLPEGGRVDTKIWEENGRLHIRVSSPLAPPRTRKTVGEPAQGLDNIRQRFEGQYGHEASLVTTEENGRFIVTVALPTRGGEA